MKRSAIFKTGLAVVVAALATSALMLLTRSEAPRVAGGDADRERSAVHIIQRPGWDYSNPKIAVSPDGEVMVAWLGFSGTTSRVLASRYRNGAWMEPIVVSGEEGDCFPPEVIADPTGGFLVVIASPD